VVDNGCRPPLERIMARRTIGRRSYETLSRSVDITLVKTRVSVRPDDPNGRDPIIESSAWLELLGTADGPIKGTRDVEIHISAAEKVHPGAGPPACVGAIIQVRPAVSVVVQFPHLDFDRLWAMALAGRLTHAHLAFVKPHYGKARVLSLSVSSAAEE
jgi:hypothetical protein